MNAAEDPAAVETLEAVVRTMDAHLARAREERSRAGFFLALYRRVTLAVSAGIAAGRFEDGARMERFAVRFARRYLDEVDRFAGGGSASRTWREALADARNRRLIVLQHLLIGINAHINLDLGVAAAESAPGAALASLRRDFDAVGAILAELVDDSQERVARVSPWLGLLDRLGGREDEAMVRFSLERARNAAWDVALDLAARSPDGWPTTVGALDEAVARRGRGIRWPGLLLTLGAIVIRLAESRDVRRIIDVLAAAR